MTTEPRPLLAIDGDSFAHRAFHGVPRSVRRANGRPGNLLSGLTSMVMRLCQAEAPRAVIIGWDSLGVPTYRNELLEGYQGGREFDPELVEQLELAPDLLAAGGIVCVKESRLRGRRRPRGGRRVRARARRDDARGDLRSRRVPARRTRCHDPAAAEGRLRDGPDRARRGCASATASSRSRCRTSSRFAVTRPTRSPAPAGSERRRLRCCSPMEARWMRCSQRAASRSKADALEMYRRIATLDAGVPLPGAPGHRCGLGGDGGGGTEAGARTARRSPGGRLELISHPALGHLHPTSHHQHPEREERIDRLLAVLGPARDCRRGEP